MRMWIVGATLAALVMSVSVVAAQDTAKAQTFSGIKLTDMKARTPEQTVTVSLGKDALAVMDPVAKTEMKSFPYASLKVSHTVSSAPPEAAGAPESAATQRGQMPTYMAKAERNWLTLKSDSDQAVLRVSSKVYDELKAALEAKGVTIEDAK